MPIRRTAYHDSDDFPGIRTWLAGRANPTDDAGAVEDRVRAILADVKSRGDAALVDYTKRFDCPDFTESLIRVSADDAAAALKAERSPQFDADLAIIAEAADNIRRFHEAQREKSWFATGEDGTVLGQLVRPVDRVGLYVPGGVGGETPLISSLLMNAIPAKVAGVGEIAVVSPPRKDGSLNPYLLAAADMLGVDQVFRVGSAWAVAALSYGTETIKPVDVVAGPGNIYVTTAKRLLIGTIGIDMIAGPSEIVVLAEPGAAEPAWIAADMLSQAEHDPLASAIVVVLDAGFGDAIVAELKKQLAKLPRNEIAAKSLADWGAVVIAADMDAAIDCVNRLAPEHFELAVHNPWEYVGKIRHAGAIFMGGQTAEPVGDYFAGPNHVLPTLGAARFSQALSVENFIKKTSLISVNADYIGRHGDKIARFARLEGLEAHARSVEARKSQPAE